MKIKNNSKRTSSLNWSFLKQRRFAPRLTCPSPFIPLFPLCLLISLLILASAVFQYFQANKGHRYSYISTIPPADTKLPPKADSNTHHKKRNYSNSTFESETSGLPEISGVSRGYGQPFPLLLPFGGQEAPDLPR